ncbi:WXG100 family type VII secretion target [Kitasatospora sp. NPDC056446]|uniref:WXG100 family type VII secretion target n=1 Tax=Kitasatospora sp. NPDC056446 TaxID=3345819 RepID=UPI00367BEADA
MADDGAKAGGPTFKISPGDLKAAAPTFEAQSKALKEALDTLKRGLTAAGSPWGGDKQGNEFAQAYNGPHDKVLSALDTLVTGLASIHDGLVAHADNHTGADSHVRKSLTP